MAETSTSNIAGDESSASKEAPRKMLALGIQFEGQVEEHEDDTLVDRTTSSIIEAGEELGVTCTRTTGLDEEAHTRNSLGLMPDFWRRELAAKLAMKMAVTLVIAVMKMAV